MSGLDWKPTVTTLCGSSRFKEDFARVNRDLTLAGEIVISLGLFGHADFPAQDWSTGGTETKVALDDLHKRKIDISDGIYVVNPNGYVGESTRSEIAYAVEHGKTVRYLEPPYLEVAP